MIADKLLDLIFLIAQTIVSILPEYSPGHGDVFSQFFGAVSFVNEIFPVDTLAECVTAYFGFIILSLGLKPILKFCHIA